MSGQLHETSHIAKFLRVLFRRFQFVMMVWELSSTMAILAIERVRIRTPEGLWPFLGV